MMLLYKRLSTDGDDCGGNSGFIIVIAAEFVVVLAVVEVTV